MIDLRDAIVAAIGEGRAFERTMSPKPTSPCRGRCRRHQDEDYEPEYDDTKPLALPMVGRPNAGKSTLINRFLARIVCSPVRSGITRDSISVEWDWRGRKIKMFRHRRHAPSFAHTPRSWKSCRSPIRCAPCASPKP